MSFQTARYFVVNIAAVLGFYSIFALHQGASLAAEFKVYDNVDIDIARLPYRSSRVGAKVTQDLCFKFCLGDSACKAVVFVKQTQRCRFYKDTSSAIVKRGAIAGFVGPVSLPSSIVRPPNAPPAATQQADNNSGTPASSNYTLQVGWDYPGADLRQLKDTNFNACVTACDANNSCVAFNYDMRNDWCFLKRFLGNRTPDEKGFTAIKKLN